MYKQDFPIFQNNKDLVFLDNSATTQKPYIVIEEICEYYKKYNSNIHRGLYNIAIKTDELFENSRSILCKYLNKYSTNKINIDELVFTTNTTDGINRIAYSLDNYLNEGEVIITSVLEHSSNILPWMKLAKQKKCILEVLSIDEDYNYDLNQLNEIIRKYKDMIKIISLSGMSNVIGNITNYSECFELIQKENCIKILDAAQLIPSIIGSSKKFNYGDIMVFSGHKIYAPNGVGVLYINKRVQNFIDPGYLGGGSIYDVNQKSYVLKEYPSNMEAGTPDIASIIGLGTALEYLNKTSNITYNNYQNVKVYMYDKLKNTDGVKLINKKYSGIMAFNYKNYHSHDVAQILSDNNICVRAGLHCAYNLHKVLNISNSVRVSVGIYNDPNDIDMLLVGLSKIDKILG